MNYVLIYVNTFVVKMQALKQCSFSSDTHGGLPPPKER